VAGRSGRGPAVGREAGGAGLGGRRPGVAGGVAGRCRSGQGRAWRRLAGLVVALGALALGTPALAVTWVTGYYASYSESGVGMSPTDLDYSILTHVIHWPVVPRADGTFDPDEFGLTAAQSAALLGAARAAGTKAILGFGGEVDSVGDGWRGATSPARRADFIARIVDLVQTRGYDGVDINWEGINADDPVDQEQFPAFVLELRAALDQISPRPLLTMPPTTGSDAVPGLVAQVLDAFDQVNLQTYVMSGGFPGWVTWFNSPLFRGDATFPTTGGPLPSADEVVDRFQAAGIPRARMGLGIQLDAVVWSGGSGTDTGGVSQPRQSWTYGDGQGPDPGVPTVSFLRVADALTQFTEDEGFESFFDDVARVPWLGRDRPGEADDRFVSLENARSIQEKIAFAQQKGLGGIFVFELSGDFFPDRVGDARHPLLAALRGAATPPPTRPTLKVDLEGTSFGPGQTVTVRATLTPGTVAEVVDAYVVVRLPDQSFLSLVLGGPPVPGIVPIAAGLTPVAFDGELLRYTFTGAEPAGQYTVLSGLAAPGTLDAIGGVDQDVLTFQP
jgi:chitinase